MINSPSSTTVDVTAISDNGLHTSDDNISVNTSSSAAKSGSRRHLEQIISKQQNMINKLKMDVVILKESLHKANSADLDILQTQLDDAILDLRRTRQRNSELKAKLWQLEEQSLLRGSTMPRKSLEDRCVVSGGSIDEPSGEKDTPLPLKATAKESKVSVKFSGVPVPKDDASRLRRRRFEEILASMSPQDQLEVQATIDTLIETARLADLNCIKELSSELRSLQRDDETPPEDPPPSAPPVEPNKNEAAAMHSESAKEAVVEARTSGIPLYHYLLSFSVGVLSILICAAIVLSNLRCTVN